MSSTIDAYAWMDQAACKDMDLSEHDPFDPPTGGKYQSFVDEALAICARCPVVDECLTDALRMGDVYGVKGGKTGPEREAILNPKKVVPAQRAPVENRPETAAEAAARAKKNERNARSRNRHKDRINAERREARRTEGTYAGMTEDAIERRRERNREYQARARERNRERYAGMTEEQRESRRLRQRELGRKDREGEQKDSYNARQRERYWEKKAAEKSELEAAELVDEVVEETAVDQAELSVA